MIVGSFCFSFLLVSKTYDFLGSSGRVIGIESTSDASIGWIIYCFGSDTSSSDADAPSSDYCSGMISWVIGIIS